MKMKTTHQNLWDAAKATVRGQFRAIHAYIKNKQRMLTPQDMKKRTKENLKIIIGYKIESVKKFINLLAS